MFKQEDGFKIVGIKTLLNKIIYQNYVKFMQE